ncbi:MAG: cell division protein SepF [Candidatus Caenarcaniphilales bacterium]|nr:cell division protein SepF [Candidatus Caenarcaniphilales bacterium]
MSIVEKIKSFWLGSEESYDEGFDDLFRIESGLGNAQQSRAPISTDISPSITSKTKMKEPISGSLSSNNLKVLEQPMYSATNEVIVLEPTSFNQAPDVLQYLRRGSSIVLNLCKLDAEQSQRLIDFICGGIYALDGSQRRVGEGVFLLVPNSVNINSVDNRENKLISSFWTQAKD